MSEKGFEGWAILELMGHRKLAGYLREQEVAGASFLRIDVPDEADVNLATQFYSASAVYCITPVTEDLARRVAKGAKPAPVTRWELPQERAGLPPVQSDNGDDGDDFDDEADEAV